MRFVPVRSRYGLRASLLAGLLTVAAACGDGMTPIVPGPIPPVPPPPVVTPPVIKSVTVGVTRAEVDRDLTVRAEVEDAETPVAALTYQWSATVGTFSGSGSTVTWRLAQGSAATPVSVIVTLTVIEPYQALEGGRLVTREHRVIGQATPFRAHDSVGEISRIARTFLVDYFGNSSVSPDACLVDFSRTCSGRDAERADIVKNRAERRITSAQAIIRSVMLNADATFAWVVAPCVFRDIELATGKPFVASGDCELTAVYEQQRWWLCESYFRNGSVVPGAFPSRTPPPGAGRYWDYAVPDW